jgi:Protein of unknown function (DUF2442)
MYEITYAEPRPDHTVTIAFSDGAEGVGDFTPLIQRGELFAALEDPRFFVQEMRLLPGGSGWPGPMIWTFQRMDCGGMRFLTSKRSLSKQPLGIDRFDFEGSGRRVIPKRPVRLHAPVRCRTQVPG